MTTWPGRIATGSYDTTIKIHRWDNWQTIAVLQHHSQAVWEVRSLGGLLASCGLDGRVVLAKLQDDDAKQLYELSVPCEMSMSVELTDNGYLLAGGDGGTVSVFEADYGVQVTALKPGHRKGITAIRARGRLAATAGCDRDVRVWNFITGVCVMVCKVRLLVLHV